MGRMINDDVISMVLIESRRPFGAWLNFMHYKFGRWFPLIINVASKNVNFKIRVFFGKKKINLCAIFVAIFIIIQPNDVKIIENKVSHFVMSIFHDIHCRREWLISFFYYFKLFKFSTNFIIICWKLHHLNFQFYGTKNQWIRKARLEQRTCHFF
jgi:hypothetical protein